MRHGELIVAFARSNNKNDFDENKLVNACEARKDVLMEDLYGIIFYRSIV
jgi:hypothetical protein